MSRFVVDFFNFKLKLFSLSLYCLNGRGFCMKNPFRLFFKKKVGVALGSGGAKGLAHIAVLEYLEQLQIPIHFIAGSSIGAVIGAVYAAGTLPDFKRDMLKFTKKELLSLIDLTLPRSGLLKGNDFIKFMRKYIPADLKLEDLKIPLEIVATDYYTGACVVFKKGNVLDAIRASVSIPGFFIPVAYNNSFLIDGGVANPLPIDIVSNAGMELTVAVNLHPGVQRIEKGENIFGKSFHKIKSKFKDDTITEAKEVDAKKITIPEEVKLTGIIKSIEEWISKKNKAQSYPSIFEIIIQSIDIMGYSTTVNMLKHYKPTVLIEPDLLATGTLDFYDAYRIMTVGYKTCEAKRSELVKRIARKI